MVKGTVSRLSGAAQEPQLRADVLQASPPPSPCQTFLCWEIGAAGGCLPQGWGGGGGRGLQIGSEGPQHDPGGEGGSDQ